MANPDPTRLLRNAARCYRLAGLYADAGRCLSDVNDHLSAATLFEQGHRLLDAARCYRRARHWADAARCYRLADHPLETADCLEEAGDILGAGWALAHEARHPDRARFLLGKLVADDVVTHHTLAVIRARCQVPRHTSEACRAIEHLAAELNLLPGGRDRDRLAAWALGLARLLNRPDLTALLLTGMVEAGVPNAQQAWEAWALPTLGTAEGPSGKRHGLEGKM